MLIDDITSAIAGQLLFDKSDDSGSGESIDEVKTLLSNLDSKISKALPDDVIDSLKSLAGRSGVNKDEVDPLHKILFNDNYQLREKLKNAKDATLEEGKVAVDEDRAKLLEKLEEREIKSSEDLDTHFTNFEKVQSENREKDQKIKSDKARELYGANPNVLQKLLKTEEAELEIGKTKDDDGNEIEVVQIVKDDQKTNFKEFAESNWKDFEASLFNGESDSDVQTGRKFVKQGSQTIKKTGEKGKEFLEKRNKRVSKGNPLKGQQESKSE